MIAKACGALALALTLLCCSAQAGDKEVASGANDVAKIDRAWDEVYKNIGWLTRYVRDLTKDGDAAERFDMYKFMMSALNDNYLQSVYASTDRPEYLPYTHPVISNYGGPNHDFKMGMVHLEPGASYRVWGKRGNADVLDIQQYSGWFGMKGRPIGSHAQGTFDSNNIKVDERGNFEFIMSPEKPASGQWWKTEKDTVVLMIRDIFLDHTIAPIPAHYYFEKLGPKKEGPTTISADEAADRLYAFAQSLKDMDVVLKFPDIPAENVFVVKGWFAKPKANDPEYLAKLDEKKIKPVEQKRPTAGQVTQTYHMALYRVKPGQALIGEWTPTKEFFSWNILLNTRLLQSLNFYDRQTDINNKEAYMGSDGVFRFVISHKDPGVANWLDADGHPLGSVLIRCKLCDARGALPTLKLVPESDVMKYLPKETRKVAPEERQRLLTVRRQHFLTRFHQ